MKSLHETNLLKLVVIDEAHMIPMTDVSFRPDFANLKHNLFQYTSGVPIVAMTATMTKDLLRVFSERTGIERFDNVTWGDISRRDVNITICTKAVPTHFMKSCVQKHLKRRLSKVIVYSNAKHYAKNNAVKSVENVLKTRNLEGEVLSVHGDTSLGFKQWVGSSFCDHLGKDDTNFYVRVLAATESADCGIDATNCTLCVCVGAPPSLASLSQRLGRVGRDAKKRRR